MKVFKNYIYTSFYQLFSILVPIITTPYISRALGIKGIGVAAATLSIAQFFLSISKLGVVRFGTREIASSDSLSLPKKFFNIFISHLVIGMTVLTVYLGLATCGLFGENRIILYIQSLYILSAIFDISWFFQGVQDFRVTVTRGIFIKLSSLLLIFVFVKDKGDLVKYVAILATTNFFGTIVLWKSLSKYIDLSFADSNLFPNFATVKKLLKGSFLIFLPLWGTQLNSILDVMILNFTSNDIQVGSYSNALKIVTIPMYLLTSLSSVMLPRVSSEIKTKKIASIFSLIKSTMEFMLYFACPLTIGLMAVSRNLTLWFLGSDFSSSSIIIIVLAIKIVFVALNETIGILYLIPLNRSDKYFKATLIGVGTGVLLNLILSKIIGGVGTSISYVIVEVIIFVVLIVNSPEIIKVFPVVELIKDIIGSVLMGGGILLFSSIIDFKGILLTLFQMIFGIAFYFCITLLLKSSITLKVSKYLKNV